MLAAARALNLSALVDIVGVLFFGFAAGLLARYLAPGQNKSGLLFTLVLGVCGAAVSTWLGSRIGFYKAGENAGFIAAVVGGIVIILLVRFIRQKD